MALVVSMFLMPFLYGFVIMRLWTWFVEPLCHVHLGWLFAVGISEIVGVVALQAIVIPKELNTHHAAILTTKILSALWSLLFGWAIHAALVNGWAA